MASYTDVFGNQTLPPAQYGYSSLTLTASLTVVWPYNSDDAANTLSKIVDIACASGNVLTLPDATQVSVGEDFLLRNVGSFALTIKNASGVQIATVAVGAASYFYLTDNTLVAGVFGVIGFGVGTSTADAGSLVGYGVKAIGASLNQCHPVVPVASSLTLDDTYRAKLVSFTGGTGTFSLTSAATLGDDYFTMIRNNGTGTLTIDPASAELVDGQSSLQLQPSESMMLISTGTQWYSVGYGRSTLYQFTQLVKDVSAGGTFTLSSQEASNKLLTFIGNPGLDVTVVVPAVVTVYYTYSNISTAFSITLKTSAGSGTVVPQGVRVIAICDGTNVLSAQSAVANSSVSLTDGSAAVPSLFFSNQTNTGLYKFGTYGVGVAANGASVAAFDTTGPQFATIGPNGAQQHTLPAVPSDTVVLSAASQTLTNKTISAANNAIITAASGNLVAVELNAALSELQTDIDTRAASSALTAHTGDTATAHGVSGAVVGTNNTQTLTSKTIALGSNTVSGTLAQFNAAVTDADLVSLAGPETLTNKSFGNAVTITDNSASPALKVTQTGAGNALEIHDVASDTTPFVIDANGMTSLGFLNVFRQQTGSVVFDATPTSGAYDGLIWNASDSTGYYSWQANGIERMRIGADGTVVVGGAITTGASSTFIDHTAHISSRTDRSWGGSQSECRAQSGAPHDFASTTYHCQDQSSAYQWGYDGNNQKFGLFDSSGGWTGGWSLSTGAFEYGAFAINTAYIPSTTAQFQLSTDVLFTSKNKAIMGNMYYSSGWKYVGNGPGCDIKFAFTSDIAFAIEVAANNTGGAGAVASVLTALLIKTDGAVLANSPTGGLGYGIGAGGTVTQVTSKSASVTLNKPCGQITMNNAALAAGASVNFQFNNTLIGASDMLLCVISNSGAYSARSLYVADGYSAIQVTNNTAGSLSDSVVINFTVIKGSTT